MRRHGIEGAAGCERSRVHKRRTVKVVAASGMKKMVYSFWSQPTGVMSPYPTVVIVTNIKYWKGRGTNKKEKEKKNITSTLYMLQAAKHLPQREKSSRTHAG